MKNNKLIGKIYKNRFNALKTAKKHNLKVNRFYQLEKNHLNQLIRVYYYRLEA